MARLRFSLYGKILIWFVVNLAVLALLGLGFMRVQFKLGLDWILEGPGGARIEQLADTLTSVLRNTPEAEWSGVLAQHGASQGLTLALFGSDGEQKLGPVLDVPKELRPRLVDKRSAVDAAPPPRPRQPRMDRSERQRDAPQSPPPGQPRKPRFMVRTMDPTRYWAGIHLTLAYGTGEARRPLTLVLVSDSITGRGFFFDPWPWVALLAGGLTLSALIWLPLVGGITAAIRRTNDASRRIASGRFDVRIPERRSDELGELASAVNAMAEQLGDYVAQQRRVTADIAHELCSPIARMQMALGVVEARSTPEQATYLGKLDSELQHMAKLVEELLNFAKAEALREHEAPTDILLDDLVRQVNAREAPDADVRCEVPAGLHLHTLRSALDRALGNVVRNAVRYAAHAGPIHLRAALESSQVVIRVSDQGPGVPDDALLRLFEPFYRPEAARARHTGGSGLGLAITQRCINSCGGTVEARKLHPNGLEVILRLPMRLPEKEAVS